jgi:hypothetical protein
MSCGVTQKKRLEMRDCVEHSLKTQKNIFL